ncbi:neuronal pentraxin-1-like [Dendronephthya gigantea]|uniref:neuronal pentraxin-1-like n=1 Tax=Dendronephthya gigantea TaxID=151771 RepID=UPI00106B969E|nr:neuronal pentraxin-1-like [Dendronephthya gigantea]
MMNAVLKIVFFLGILGLSASAKSFKDCCQSFLDELKKKSEAAVLLCSLNNQSFVPLPFGKHCNCKTLKTELKERWDGFYKLCRLMRKQQCSNAKSIIITRRSTVDYAISQGAPQMKEVTTCFWVKTKQVTGYAHYISYAVPLATNQIIIKGMQNLRLVIVHYASDSTKVSSSSHNIKINDGRWHHICMTWQSKDGGYSFFKDGRKVGSGTISGSVGKPIPGKGTWVLGQDQDSVGGGFDANQSATGELTGVNVWDKVLSSFEILKMSRNCNAGGPAGNVKSWADFLSGIKGNAKIGKATCCQ